MGEGLDKQKMYTIAWDKMCRSKRKVRLEIKKNGRY